MNKTIRTYNDLCEERERIKNLLVVQKQRMKDDWDGLKDELLPVKKVFGVVGKMSSPNRSNPLMHKSLKIAMDLFITKYVLGKAGWMTKLAVPFVLTNFSTHVIADKGQNFVTKVSEFLKSRKKFGFRDSAGRTTPPVESASQEERTPVEHIFGNNGSSQTEGVPRGTP